MTARDSNIFYLTARQTIRTLPGTQIEDVQNFAVVAEDDYDVSMTAGDDHDITLRLA